MNTQNKCLKNPPIIEAVLDIDCDMPPDFSVQGNIDVALNLFKDRYPKSRKRVLQQQKFTQKLGETVAVEPSITEVHAVQMLQGDEKQIVQVRNQGYSFNRLAPYSGLDDYLPEIERTWLIFQDAFKPVQIRRVSLRFINQIFLPFADGENLDLDLYLKNGPRLADDSRMIFADFLNQHHILEKETGNQAKIILASQPALKNRLPLILDIEASRVAVLEPQWNLVADVITSLRSLKNHIFSNTLSDKCITLFNQA